MFISKKLLSLIPNFEETDKLIYKNFTNLLQTYLIYVNFT